MANSKKRQVRQWELVLAGAGSGALVGIIDFTKNQNDGTIKRLGNALGGLCFPRGEVPWTFPGTSAIAILFIIICSLFVCWLFEVKDRADAFLRACALLAAFSVISPTTINTLIDPASRQGGILQENKKTTFNLIDTAAAEDSTRHDEAAPAGTAFIVMKHLRENRTPPESIITIRNQGAFDPVAIFRTHSFRIALIQPYGRQFLVQIDTPGYRSISFAMRLTEPIEAYSIEAPPTRLLAAVQGLAEPLKVATISDDAERLKERGRSKLIGENIQGALADYVESLHLNPNDAETRHFLAYAYFRAGKNAEAKELLTKLREEYRDSSLINLNLLKVNCALQDETVREQFVNAAPEWKAAWAFDGEFERVCAKFIGR